MRVVLVSMMLAGVAQAQPAGDLRLDPFRPAIDARGYLTLDATSTLDHGDVAFGLGALSWGRRLLSFESADASFAIDDVVTATLVAAVGLRLGPAHLELGASLPLTVLAGPTVTGQGLGNVGLHLKAPLVETGGLGIGLAASVFLPTANPSERFMGEPRVTPQLIGIADATFGRLRLGINGGVRLRDEAAFTDAMGTGRTIAMAAELPFGAGAGYQIARERFEVLAELVGAVPLGAHENYQPLEALGGIKVYLAKNSFLTLGAGRGLATGRGGSPDARAFIGIVFEPKAAARAGGQLGDDPEEPAAPPAGDPVTDRDGDKILDTVDGCPDQAEDYDDWRDADGCPDLDNDGDRIVDLDDLCPDAPEDYDGVEDDDGCPDLDRDLVIDKGSTLVTLEPINFEYNKAVIRPDSYRILDAVVAALGAHPDIKLVEVAGHTDERGDDAYNLDLSIRRAAAVKDYLIAHGVAAGRLESQGYGETQPVDPRHGEAAWRKNRRVDFVILSR